MTVYDRAMMQLALQEAEKALYLTSPNPRVGCVLVSPAGEVIGTGHTQAVGGAHAEVMALRDAATKNHATQGATAYVTLEPCCHQGRTGPCTEALMGAGVKRVVAALKDPNPLVSGNGLKRLSGAGLEVECLPSDDSSALAAYEQNIGFIKRMTQGTPWVRVKAAASLDGITALLSGESQWITGEASRKDGHHYRARACAVLTGIGTVLADDPRLDVRLVDTPRQPALVIVDSKLETPVVAKLFQATTPARPIWIYTASTDTSKTKALQDLGATVICLPDASGKVDLAAMMQDLGQRQINELHVEAGFKLNGSLAKAALVDEWLIYLAPLLLGTGSGIANATPPVLQAAQRLALHSITPVGHDLRGLWRVIK